MNRLISFVLASLFSLNLCAADTWLPAQLVWEKQRDLGLLQSGIVQSLKVKVGDKVKAGQTLATLDTRALNARKKAAQAYLSAQKTAYKQAKTDWKRTKDLHEQVLIAQHEMEKADTVFALAKAELAKAEAKLAQCQKNLRESSLKAPFSGEVSAVYVDAGQALNNQQQMMPVLQLRDNNTALLQAQLSREQVLGLQLGQALEIRSGETQTQATLTAIRPQQGAYVLQLRPKTALSAPVSQLKLP